MLPPLKAGFLSFDSTRVSSSNVDFPIDVVLYKKNSFSIVEKRYEMRDLENISKLWAEKLKRSLDEIPEDWMESILQKV